MINKILELLIAAGLLNVWIFRFNRATPYRGGSAVSMKQEFASYGLPEGVMYLVGSIKILAALLLIAGLRYPVVIPYTAATICILMLGAVAMHLKVRDPVLKTIPALAMLSLSTLLALKTFF